ncbi:hypothetical protein [Rhizosaccharibacter radicis]|uniref:Uncharacterized protein n=1 Tax=Rhizosaccharibacter radicis TaxID=2782605 RepID=A0ABT1VSF3_9PROT|nr:hypothetical protein [Acetobacteraceae bacterium KSS12]
MTQIRMLEPHDPLPDAPAVVLMRRFEEDDPRQAMIELIVLEPGGREHNRRLLAGDGSPMPWDAANREAAAAAQEEGLDAVYHVDRTRGPRESEILGHGGDHSVGMDKLVDDDLEDGEHGPDMRDEALHHTAPRRF